MPQVTFWRGGHTFHRLMYHVVFVPKYRRKVLRAELVRRLTQLWYQCCRMNRWYIHELAILPDHVHLIIQIPPRTPLPKAVQYLKGGSSKVIRKEYPELEEWLWGDNLWAEGYFAETVGRADEKTMRQYVREQWAQEPPTKHRLSSR